LYTSRAENEINAIDLPSHSKLDNCLNQRLESSRPGVSSSGVRKPIAGVVEESKVLSRYQTKIGKNFLLEKFLPPKQQAPPTTEGEFTNKSNKSTFTLTQSKHTVYQRF